MEWWLWVVVGLLFMGAELLTPGGFFMMFFGVGGILVGLLVALGLGISPTVQIFLFSIISILLLVLFRSKLVAALNKGTKEVDSLVGQRALASTSIAPGADGKVELRGSPWNARNVGEEPIRHGDKCVVKATHGITLDVVKE